MKSVLMILVAFGIICGCTRQPQIERTIRITSDQALLDGVPVGRYALKRILSAEVRIAGSQMLVRIETSPETPVLETITDIAVTGDARLTFAVDGVPNAMEFRPRPWDIYGPPVYEITALISPEGTTAVTSAPPVIAESSRHSFGTRIYFRATSETTGRELYRQMKEWQEGGAYLLWDGNIESNSVISPKTRR